MRTINGRQQLLIQDEVQGAGAEIQWRMQYAFHFLSKASLTDRQQHKRDNYILQQQSAS